MLCFWNATNSPRVPRGTPQDKSTLSVPIQTFLACRAIRLVLYKEIEELSGQSVGLHMTGGFYLASTQEWYDYLKRERSKARYMGLSQEFISPEEVAKRHPLIDPKHYLAALWDDQDGDLDPSGATYAFAKAAKVHGANYHTHTPVTETKPTRRWQLGCRHTQRHDQCGNDRQLRRFVGTRSRQPFGLTVASAAYGTSLSYYRINS